MSDPAAGISDIIIIMKYKLIIFDLDGTLLNTLEDLTDSVNYALRSLNFPERSLDEVNSFIGNGNRMLMKRSLPEWASDEQTELSIEKFHEYYRTHYTVKTRPYNGIPELLHTLRAAGYKLAVISNKADYATQELCEKYFFNTFDFVLGDTDDIPRKPDPAPVHKAVSALNCSPESSVYVGDSEVDIKTAKNAGIDCISVGWGFRPRSVLIAAGAERIIASPEELLKLV